MTRKRFLLATFEGGGAVAPFITVARKLLAAGHQVRIVSDQCNRAEAEAVGAAFSPWTRAPSRVARGRDHEPVRDWEAANGFEGFCMLLDQAMVGQAQNFAEDMRDILTAHPADLVIINDLIPRAMMGCEAMGQPFAILGCNPMPFPVLDGVPPLGTGLTPPATEAERAMIAQMRQDTYDLFDTRLPAYNAARAAIGLPPLAHFCDQIFAARRFLLATSAAFDFVPEPQPEFLCYVGPQLDDNLWSRPWASPFAANDDRPLVLVGFSTTFQNQAGSLQRTIDALATLDVRAVVTLGDCIAMDEVTGAPNVAIVESAPHNQLLRDASLLVTHGGHGTVLKGVMAGVPMLVMPHGRDQADNGARIAHRGAGLVLPPDAESAAIAAALHRLLTERALTDGAARLSAACRADHDDDRIVRAIEELARPVRRPAAMVA